jgi:hypothetical protein
MVNGNDYSWDRFMIGLGLQKLHVNEYPGTLTVISHGLHCYCPKRPLHELL